MIVKSRTVTNKNFTHKTKTESIRNERDKYFEDFWISPSMYSQTMNNEVNLEIKLSYVRIVYMDEKN